MRRQTFIAILLLAGACSDEPNAPPAEMGSIQIAVSTGAVTIAPGGAGSLTATLTRVGGYTGDVTIAVSGLPVGITATVTPQQLTGATTTATINLTVGASTAPGLYPVLVTAVGQGVSQASSAFQITVPPAPAFALSVPSGGATIVTSGSGTLRIALQRTNFTGPIELTLLNPPLGVTATITPESTTADSALLTLVVSPTATPGVIPLILRARAPGLADRTVQFDLTIRTPAAGTRVEYQFCHPSEAPVFFAYQDGAGAWQAVSGFTQGSVVRYGFDIASGRGGVAMVFATSTSANVAQSKLAMRRSLVASRMQAAARRSHQDAYETIVLFASTHQLVEDGMETCAATQPTRTVTAAVSGVPVGSYGILSYGNTTQIYNPAETPGGTVTFTGVPNGLNDFVGARTTPGNAPDRILVIRNLDVPAGGSLPAIDFNAATALTPAVAQVTVAGTSNELLETFVDLVTANNNQGLWMELASTSANVRTWAGLRPQDMMSSDFHGLTVFASSPNESGDFRVALKYVDYVTNQTLALGSPISLPNITQIPASTRLRFQGVLPADYDRGIAFSVADTSGTGNFSYLTATSSYLASVGSAFTYNLAMPDLTALTGFPISSVLPAGNYDVAVDAFGFNGPGVFNPRPVRGGQFRAAVRNTAIVVN